MWLLANLRHVLLIFLIVADTSSARRRGQPEAFQESTQHEESSQKDSTQSLDYEECEFLPGNFVQKYGPPTILTRDVRVVRRTIRLSLDSVLSPSLNTDTANYLTENELNSEYEILRDGMRVRLEQHIRNRVPSLESLENQGAPSDINLDVYKRDKRLAPLLIFVVGVGVAVVGAVYLEWRLSKIQSEIERERKRTQLSQTLGFNMEAYERAAHALIDKLINSESISYNEFAETFGFGQGEDIFGRIVRDDRFKFVGVKATSIFLSGRELILDLEYLAVKYKDIRESFYVNDLGKIENQRHVISKIPMFEIEFSSENQTERRAIELNRCENVPMGFKVCPTESLATVNECTRFTLSACQNVSTPLEYPAVVNHLQCSRQLFILTSSPTYDLLTPSTDDKFLERTTHNITESGHLYLQIPKNCTVRIDEEVFEGTEGVEKFEATSSIGVHSPKVLNHLEWAKNHISAKQQCVGPKSWHGMFYEWVESCLEKTLNEDSTDWEKAVHVVIVPMVVIILTFFIELIIGGSMLVGTYFAVYVLKYLYQRVAIYAPMPQPMNEAEINNWIAQGERPHNE